MEIIELLLKKGAYGNARDSYSVTPLHLAVENGSKEIVKLLLKHGAYVNSPCDCTFGEGHTVWLDVKKLVHLGKVIHHCGLLLKNLYILGRLYTTVACCLKRT